MINLQNTKIHTEWIQQVRNSLCNYGYHYEPNFCKETNNAKPIIKAAKLLGTVLTSSQIIQDDQVLITQPSTSAKQSHPFDRHEPIGWHNDFSTCAKSPELSLSWIRQEDMVQPYGGAWRVASAAEILSKLCQTKTGKQLVKELSEKGEPFGYRATSKWRTFRIITRINSSSNNRGLRFYGRPIREGAYLKFGKIPNRTRDIIFQVQEAADAVGEVLSASTGSLLIVHNRLSLHDRLEQQVTGPKHLRRQAYLCFVKKLYQPL